MREPCYFWSVAKPADPGACPFSEIRETAMQEISRQEVLELMRKNASLVEVLPEQNFRKAHLRGDNVPFDQAFDDHIQSAVWDKTVPVIVYCADVNCQLSPQAAERLDRLGYTKVFDYKAGKADWQKAKLQVESS
jgi:rhodanese-related sulfurtransferase